MHTETARAQSTTPAPMKYHNRRQCVMLRSPFINRNETGVNYWDVPRTGGYGGGCRTGSALAQIYLDHIGEHPPSERIGGMLQHIVFSMVDSLEASTSDEERASIRGQIVGFMGELEGVAEIMEARRIRTSDTPTPAELLTEANAGLVGPAV